MRLLSVCAAALVLAACADERATAAPSSATIQSASGSGPAVEPQARSFRDWQAVCDNGNRCVAYSGAATGWIRIALDAGPTAIPSVMVGLWPEDGEALTGPLTVVIDGKRHATASGPAETGSATIAPDKARQLISDLAAGQALALSVGSQTADLPSAGVSAALLWIDERQGRLETSTALIRRGARSVSAVPAAPALPVVVAAPAVSQAGFEASRPLGEEDATAVAIPAPLRAVAEVRQCQADTAFNPYLQKAVTAARLNASTELWGIPCDSGAYNVTYAYFLTGAGGADPRPARFPALEDASPAAEPGAEPDRLINSVYDPETRTLSAFAKSRGLGDCGVLQTWTWTGQAFVLSGERRMDDCWGMVSDFWPTIWRTR